MSTNSSSGASTSLSSSPPVTSSSSDSLSSSLPSSSSSSTTGPPSASTSTTSSSPPVVSTTSTTPSLSSSTSSITSTPTISSATSQTTSAPTTASRTTVKSIIVTSGNGGLSTVYVTHTISTSQSSIATSSLSAATTTGGGALPSSSTSSQSGGLSASGTIAVAVVVPVASVALIILALLYWWRRHKANKAAEEERRKEVEEYSFNPNSGPDLTGAAVAGTYGDKDSSAGYRGWGTTSTTRKASTNLSSGVGIMSDAGSVPGYGQPGAPSEGTGHYEPGDAETVAALGAAPVASNNRNQEIRRGPSNASSAYSAANHSEGSEDGHMAGGVGPGNTYYDDGNPYFMDGHPQGGGYGDPMYGGGGQPVIRDVQARRNTRIESPSTSYQQGNAGIAQNF